MGTWRYDHSSLKVKPSIGLSCEDDGLNSKLHGISIGMGTDLGASTVQCFVPQEEKLPPGDTLVAVLM